MARSFAQSGAAVAGLQYLGTIALLPLILCPSEAKSGAWTPEKGRVNAIVSTSISQTPVTERAITTDLYYERGLGRGWALVLAPSFSDQESAGARNEAQVSLRRSLYQDHGWAVSTQVGAYMWQEPQEAQVSSGGELRVAIGRSLGQNGWANVEAGLRHCDGTAGVRWEGTLGRKIRGKDRAIIKVFGDSEGCASNITRVQASYVYGFTPQFGIELGWRETLPNAGNWNERGAVIGLWAAF